MPEAVPVSLGSGAPMRCARGHRLWLATCVRRGPIGRVVRSGLVAILLGALGVPVTAAEALAYRSDEPRGFGWRLGDVVTRHFEIDVPAGLVLDETSLPARGRGGALELRAARIQPGPEGFTLDLEYQVFISPAEPRKLDLPGVTLRFDPVARDAADASSTARPQELGLQPWPLVVGPLVGDPAPNGSAFGDWRPDVEQVTLPTQPARRGLMAALAVAALLAAVLVLRPMAQAWWWRHRRPFATAQRAVRQALRAGPAGLDEAMRQLHAGFNGHAGRVLMLDDALALAAATPAWRPLAPAITAFFTTSRARFFGAGVVTSGFDASALQGLADELAAIERVDGARPPGSPGTQPVQASGKGRRAAA